MSERDGTDNATATPVRIGAKRATRARIRKPAVTATQADVTRLENECAGFLVGIRQAGAKPNLDVLRGESERLACIRVLIAKGVCTETEFQAEQLGVMRRMLAQILMNVEQERLAQQKPQIEVARLEDLVIARH